MPRARAVVADVLATAKAQRWDPTEVVRVLLEAEATGRNRSMLATRRKRVGFPTGKTFEVWDETLSTLPVATTSFLRTLEWVRRRENLIACGPSGTGRTLLLESLGQQAIDEGLSMSWLSLEDLGALVRRHRIDDSVNKAIARVTNVALICIDDIGLLPVSADAAEGFYRVVEASYEKRSLAISSNIHPSGFGLLREFRTAELVFLSRCQVRLLVTVVDVVGVLVIERGVPSAAVVEPFYVADYVLAGLVLRGVHGAVATLVFQY